MTRELVNILDEMRCGVILDIGGHWTGYRSVGRLETASLLLDGGRGLEAAVAEVGEDDSGRPLWRPDRLRQPRDGCGPLGARAVRTLQMNTGKQKK